MAAEGADGVVCVNLSSKLSATIEAARQGAKAVQGSVPVRVVDSLSVTLGLGLVTIEAAERARKGADLDEVAAAAERAAGRLKVYGAIDTLENLKKGGRIGGAQALVGSLLSIKPVIQVTNGVVEEESKQRTRARALRYLAGKLREAGPVDRVAACGADAPDMDEFLTLLEGVPTVETMLVGEIGPVIGTHTGPGTVGVAWLSRQSE
jgi:DegV family protein with EDD domain